MLKQRTFFILSILIFISGITQAQPTKVRGKIIDASTNEPMPFVTISLKGTTIGTITDVEGNYFLQAKSNADSVVVACVGYFPQTVKINKAAFQTVDFAMKPRENQLNEIVVIAGEDPSLEMIRKVIKNKPRNNPAKLEDYRYEVYNKMEIDVNNVDSDFQKKKVFNKLQFIFDYVDTSAETGKAYLPVFISEAISDFYFQRKPPKQKEIIKATNIAGVKNESVSQYTGQMYIDVNLYSNFIDVFGKQFVSPIADFSLLTYKYYLIDSTFLDNKWCYLISFKPKRKQELTFSGEIWINDSSWAVKKIKARIANDANINYVNDFVAILEYSFLRDSTWMLSKQELFVDFNVTDKTTGFFGRKSTTYRNFVVGERMPENFFNATMPQESIVLQDAAEHDISYWSDIRHEKLSTKEQNIYKMVDSIKEVPVFKNFVDIMTMLLGGYYVMGKFEYGPYFKTYSNNPIEGSRFRVGGRTSNDFSKKIMFNGHVAYGSKDELFKYGIGATYMFKKEPRTSFYIYHKYDMEQLGQSVNAFTEDNIMATILARSPNDNLLLVRETKSYFEKEWFLGFSNKLMWSHKQIYPSQKIRFAEKGTDVALQLTTSEFTLSTRLAYNEKFVRGEFERISFGSEYPILTVDATAGIKGVFGSDYQYYRLHVGIDHHLYISPLGYFQYKLEGGKIWGDLPFPLLKLHEGNETYAFDPFAFNMMNFYEFVSDEYASVYLEHHFEGFFFNKIPLFRKLKFREVVYGKGLIGRLSDANTKQIMDFPASLSDVRKPYFEAGVGIENILKVLRIDAIWRLSYLDKPGIEKFGIRAKIQIII